ncbi:MAG: hypothetical protein L6408_07520 [Nanoarchaeota archaeon]|nr:hypothetical protein [Nanoarchaeota archaeon]
MVNLTFHSEGREGRDREFWCSIAKYLPKDWNASLVTTLRETVEDIKDDRVTFHYVFDDEVFNRDLTTEEIEDIEHWLGFPLRVIKHYGRYTKEVLNKKKEKEILNFIAKYVIAWRSYFEKHEIDLLVGGMSSEVHCTTAWEVAERMGIKTMRTFFTFIKNSITVTDKNFNLIEWNQENYDRSEIDRIYDSLQKKLVARKERMNQPLDNAINQNLSILNPKIFLLKMKQLRENVRYMEEHKNEVCLDNTYWRTKQYVKGIIRTATVPSLCQPIKKEEKYFFFPFHFLIDAQMLLREAFVDQYDLVENISHCIPYNTYLYTRAHPSYFGSDTLYNRMKKLLEISNIRFIPQNILPQDIIKNAIAVFTINSTTGYEGIILNKPVITFGHEMYSQKGVTLAVRDFHELPNIIFKVMDDPNYGIDIEKRKEFLYKIWKNAIILEGGYKPKIDYYDIWVLTKKDSEKLAEALVKAYETI